MTSCEASKRLAKHIQIGAGVRYEVKRQEPLIMPGGKTKTTKQKDFVITCDSSRTEASIPV